MIYFELKALISILIYATIIINIVTYKEKVNKNGDSYPSYLSIVLFIVTMALFIYGLYLNEVETIYLF